MSKPNGKYTNIEFQMMNEEAKRIMPYIIENHKLDAKILFERYLSLQKEGFTAEDALKIVIARGQEI